MNKLIFANLTIDQLWDEEKTLAKIFSVRIPESEYLVRSIEDLGVFLSQSGDLVLSHNIPRAFKDYLTLFDTSWGRCISVHANPTDIFIYIPEVVEKLRGLGDTAGKTAEFAGVSRLEQELGKKLNLTFDDNLTLSREINNKCYLIELAQKGIIKTSPTRIVETPELKNFSCQTPVYLKHEWGSGGGGNFIISAQDAPLLRYIKDRLPAESKSRWLIQDLVKASREGTVFGSTANERVSVCRVNYDSNGLSFRHGSEPDAKIVVEATSAFLKVRKELIDRNYRGPIGLDFVLSTENEMFILDLNARMTKTHLIKLACERFGLSWGEVDAYRVRFRKEVPINFEGLWRGVRNRFGLNEKGFSPSGEFVVPFLVTGLEAPGSLKEISFFTNQNENLKLDMEETWKTF